MKKLWTLLLTLVFVVGLLSPAVITGVFAAEDSNPIVMSVRAVGGAYGDSYKEFDNFDDAWEDVYKKNTSGYIDEVFVKFYADWIADSSTGFTSSYASSIKDGALYIEAGIITLDLNGHTIDRNAPEDKVSSPVFYIYGGTVTFEDTSEEKTGTITGGYGKNGGGIYACGCNLTIKDVNITGNKAQDGAGVYLDDESNAKMYSGNITGNIAAGNGGGVYVGTGIYIGDDTKFELSGGNISNNVAHKDGGGIYCCRSILNMNSGSVTENEAVRGGGVCAENKTFTMNGGTIARNRSTGNGGGVFIYGGPNHETGSKFYINSGSIEENYSDGEGGGVYLDYAATITIKNATLSNNTARSHGGAISFFNLDTSGDEEYSQLEVHNSTFTGNTSNYGCGGAIYWNQGTPFYMYDVTITGNSSPRGFGGGVYVYAYSTNICLAGKVYIIDNTAFTDWTDTAGDLHLEEPKEKLYYLNTVITRRLDPDSKIGLTFGNVTSTSKVKLNRCDHLASVYDDFTEESSKCFVSNDPYHVITRERRSDGYYNIYVEGNPNPTVTGDPFLSVETEAEGKKDFYSFNSGWSYALEQSKTTDAKITLYKDWVGIGSFDNSSGFDYLENGVSDGALYLSGSCKHNITIDLNGYSIDRGLLNATTNGYVIYMDTYGSLTIIDSSEGKTGKITGGNNIEEGGLAKWGGIGGAICVDYGKLYLKGVTVTGNTATYGGAIYCDDKDDAFVYIMDGTKIYGNTAIKDGGGVYVYNGYLYIEDGEITENTAKNGGGVYWNSDNKGYFTGGKIYGNTVSGKGGGVYVANYGKIFVGGDVKVTDNNVGNLYISNKDRNVHNACGQDGSPNKPLTEGAKIGISASDSDDLISGDDSRFKEGDYKYFFTDSSAHYIRAVYDASNANHANKLYINSLTNADVRYPRVKTVSVKDSNLLESAVFDYDSQSITLTAHNTRRNFFERANLSELIECTYDTDTDYLYQMDYMRDLRNAQVYKVMSDNCTYALCTVEVVPEGGEWADEQESVDNPYKMTVTVGSSVSGFTDFGEGWAYATSQTLPTTVTLFDDWYAPGGKFEYSSGTNKGRLYVNNKDVTIDLNGNTISRNLEETTSDGQVFRIAGSSKLTIVDNSATGNGKITGGNNNGNGGAFYIDSGSLHINGGEISGNYATNGAAVYWCSGGNLCITGGVITNNLAKDNGGAIYITNNGKVYFGGTAVIKNSSKGNVYISDKDANIYHARGQADGVPDMPLRDGACIGIYASDSDDTISGDNSRFGEDDHKYFFSDSTDHYIRAVYKEGDGNHAYKLYINALKNSETKFPAIESVAVINSELLQSATVNNDTKVITLTGYASEKASFKNIALGSLIDYALNEDASFISGINALYDLTAPATYKVMNDNGTYSLYTVVMEWVCPQHVDTDESYTCDYCGEYTLTASEILSYSKAAKEATIFITTPGVYSLIFADYENEKLVNVDVVDFRFVKGINVIPQNITGFTLENGDKIMLLYDINNIVPICRPLTIE